MLELRVDYGMTAEETAGTLGVTARTVYRAWARTRRNLGAAGYTGGGRRRPVCASTKEEWGWGR